MKFSRVTLIVMVLLLMASVATAATTVTAQKRRVRPAHALPEDASQRIDVNNISMVVKNTGSFAYDTQNNAAGLEFPKGTGKTAVFAAGLWMGALVNGGVRGLGGRSTATTTPPAPLSAGWRTTRRKPSTRSTS